MARRFSGAHDGAVTALCFHGDTLYSGGADGRVIEWATNAHRVIHEGDPMLALAWWDGSLWGLERGRLRGLHNADATVALEDAHLLIAQAGRLIAVGDGVAIAFCAGLVEDARWTLPAGHTTDATMDAKRLLCVKGGDVHVVTLKTGVSKQWRRKQEAGPAFVRIDAQGRAWLVERGGFSLKMVNPDSGKPGRVQPLTRSIHTAQGGPCELDASSRYLAVVHVGRDVEVWDVERDVGTFYVTVDPNVSDQEALQGLHRVPRFKPLGIGFIREGSTPSPRFAQDVQCVAVSERTVALGHGDGGIVLVDMVTAAMSALARDKTEVLEPPRTKKLFQLGKVQATARDGRRLFTLSGHRLQTFDAACGEQVGDVALEGPAHDLVYSLAVAGDAVWASVSGGLCAWGLDGRMRARVDGYLRLLSARIAYFIDSESRPRYSVPIHWRDLVTGEHTVSTFEPPDGMTIDHGSGGLRLFGLGERCVAELYVDGGRKHRWFYDVEGNVIGAPMPFRVEFAVADATGKIIAAPTDNGWVLMQGGDVLARQDSPAGRQGLLRLCDHDVNSGRVAGHDGRHDRLNVWERDGTLVAQLPGYTFVGEAVFSEGGRHLLTANQAGVVRWWDL